MLSNFAKNEFQAIQLALIIALPSLAISGMIIPVSIMPQWLQVVSAFVPLTYGIRIFEGIMLKGWGFQELAFEFLITGVLMVVFFMLAIITSKDYMTD